MIQRRARHGVSLVEGARLCVQAPRRSASKGGKELQRLVEGLARWRGALAGGGLPRRRPPPDLSDDDLIEEDRAAGPLRG